MGSYMTAVALLAFAICLLAQANVVLLLVMMILVVVVVVRGCSLVVMVFEGTAGCAAAAAITESVLFLHGFLATRFQQIPKDATIYILAGG